MYCMDTSPANLKKKILQPIRKGRIEGGTFRRQMGFWERAQCGEFAWVRSGR